MKKKASPLVMVETTKTLLDTYTANMTYGDFGLVGSSTTYDFYFYDGVKFISFLKEVGVSQTLPTGLTTLYDLLVKLGMESSIDMTTLMADVTNGKFTALPTASRDTLIKIIKYLINNKVDLSLQQNKIWVGDSNSLPSETELYDEFVSTIPSIPGQILDIGLAFLYRTGNSKLASIKQTFYSSSLVFHQKNGTTYSLITSIPSTLYILFKSIYLTLTSSANANAGETITLDIYLGTTIIATKAVDIYNSPVNKVIPIDLGTNYANYVTLATGDISVKITGQSASLTHSMIGNIIIDANVTI